MFFLSVQQQDTRFLCFPAPLDTGLIRDMMIFGYIETVDRLFGRGDDGAGATLLVAAAAGVAAAGAALAAQELQALFSTLGLVHEAVGLGENDGIDFDNWTAVIIRRAHLKEQEEKTVVEWLRDKVPSSCSGGNELSLIHI